MGTAVLLNGRAITLPFSDIKGKSVVSPSVEVDEEVVQRQPFRFGGVTPKALKVLMSDSL
jgi:hypothetical protein